jgi:hypothetical protein
LSCVDIEFGQRLTRSFDGLFANDWLVADGRYSWSSPQAFRTDIENADPGSKPAEDRMSASMAGKPQGGLDGPTWSGLRTPHHNDGCCEKRSVHRDATVRLPWNLKPQENTMTDFDFADPDNAPLWLPIEEQVGDILENFYGQGIIRACARIALAVYAMVEKSTALPPAEKEALTLFLLTDIIQPINNLPKLIEEPVTVPTSLVEESEAEDDEERWIGVDDNLLVLRNNTEFVREELMAVAQAMERLAEL